MLSDYLADQLDPILRENVRRGIRKLDAHFGDRLWREKLDHSTLNVRRYENCVLGQLFGSFQEGLYALDVTDSEVFGFSADEIADTFTDGEGGGAVYELLTSIWNDEADGYEYEGMPVWNYIHGKYLPRLKENEWRFD